MQQLIDVFGFLSILLRGAEIAAQSFMLGGLVYSAALLQPLSGEVGDFSAKLQWLCARWIRRSALCLAFIVAAGLLVDGSVLVATVDLQAVGLLGADFVIAGLFTTGSSLMLAYIMHRARMSPTGATVPRLALGTISVIAAAMTSHAAARIGDRGALVIADFVHQSAAAVWIGGIPYFLLSLRLCEYDDRALVAIIPRFSLIATVAVAGLLAAGIGMGLVYVDSVEAVYGTAYGVMLATKVALLGILLLFGFMNNRIGARLQRGDSSAPVLRLQRLAEAEIGIGLSVFFAAATLTSVPPAVDLTTDRVTAHEIVERIMPRVPTFTSPKYQDLEVPRLQAELDARAAAENKPAVRAYVPGGGAALPINPADIVWSEYNHHWSGVLVLLIGLFGLAEKTGRAPWARHWPLIFTALAGFLVIRSDPEAWPIGDIGFFESLRDPEILQHRIFALAVAVFGVYEWTVRTGRNKSERAALVFPLLTAGAGALLLTHSHSLANVRQELLIEVTHVPLALLGIVAGWARWLEIRLPPADRRLPGWIWPICFALVGLALLDYREA